ncbi:metallophosphoesterase [Algiphilus aromaticivorans]|jgi:hypothetical protein|uniref:metallophosphoesterase n=1 Tax=Algiphilus aromaticivorans TaxID=382454 RepID=UPI0006935D33|nr:metallophosphoesterase family protein [Algiphilus aromaticivorans]
MPAMRRRQMLRAGTGAGATLLLPPLLGGCGGSESAEGSAGAVNEEARDIGGFSEAGEPLPRGIHVSFSDDPRSTRTLTWFTDTTRDPGTMIEYGPVTPDMDAEAIRNAPFPARAKGDVDPVFDVDALTHRVVAHGLDPELPVRYRVGGPGAWSSVRVLRAAPPKPDRFRFCHFGDSGVTAPAAWVRDGVMDMAPDFLIVAGDLSYADGNQPVWDEWFQQMQPLLAGTPMMASPGNHENKDANGRGYLSRTTHFSPPGSRGWYSFDYGRVHFVASTGGAFVADLRLPVEILWLEQDLARAALRRAAGEIDFIIFFNHFTVWTDQEGRGPNDPLLVTLLEQIVLRYGVDLLVVGHDHIYQRSHRMAYGRQAENGYVQVTQGAGGKSMRGFDPISDWSAVAERRFSFCEYEVEPEHITLRTWAVDDADNQRGQGLELIDELSIGLRNMLLRNKAAQTPRQRGELLSDIGAIESNTLRRNQRPCPSDHHHHHFQRRPRPG